MQPKINVAPPCRKWDGVASCCLCRQREWQRDGGPVQRGTRTGHTLAQHVEDDAFATPINIMVVDRDGKAARLVIEGGKISYH
jgi:hypothetical protein